MPKPRATNLSPREASRAPVWSAAAIIVIATLVAYHNSFAVPFLFDDLPAILENTSIRDLRAIGRVLFPDQAGGLTTSGRPLVNLSLALNYAAGGYAVWGYHAVNVALHAAGALCLFGLVRRTLAGPVLRDRFGGAALPLAGMIALLWALHPLNTSAVTYVVQRAESLAAFFYLLTLYAFARAGTSGKETRWLALSVAACACGMASKETMVTAPLIVLLYDRTFISGTFAAAWQRRGGWLIALAATWLLLAGLILSTGGRGGTAGFATEISTWSYALTQCAAMMRYVGLALWPAALVFDYGLGTVRSLADVFVAAVAVVGALVAVAIALRRWPAWGFLGAFFFAVLAPSSSFVPVATQTMAEHRMYLPLAALVSAVVLAAYVRGGARMAFVGILAVLALGGATIARNADYRSEVSIWADAAVKWPANARAHNNLGQALYRSGRIDDAIASYREALRLQPKYPETHYNLGVALAGQNDLARAIEHYETALRITADYPEALNNLGNALVRLGRVEEALRRYEEAVARRPDFAEAHNNLGNALLQLGRAREAQARFERALEVRPDYGEAYYNLGNALASAGDMTGALQRYRDALRLEPRHAGAHVNAGNALLELQRPREALEHYQAAIASDPALPDAHFNLGSVLLEMERWPEALTAFDAVLRLKPDHAEARRGRGFVLAQMERTAEAIAEFERYVAQRPDDASAREDLARLRARR